jgi:hypothetical protein
MVAATSARRAPFVYVDERTAANTAFVSLLTSEEPTSLRHVLRLRGRIGSPGSCQLHGVAYDGGRRASAQVRDETRRERQEREERQRQSSQFAREEKQGIKVVRCRCAANITCRFHEG